MLAPHVLLTQQTELLEPCSRTCISGISSPTKEIKLNFKITKYSNVDNVVLESQEPDHMAIF